MRAAKTDRVIKKALNQKLGSSQAAVVNAVYAMSLDFDSGDHPSGGWEKGCERVSHPHGRIGHGLGSKKRVGGKKAGTGLW